ncbi:MAG: hypothetical protein H6667_26275 [Ardenticatenaceae bacterium]|nr:hypothetical protein [Ardenticatenaceae bacterium]MCB9444297.1 hypothetical protein [Ardenticatenaceae bacterium]
MFYTPEDRQYILDKLLHALKGDGRIAGVLVVGSGATGFKDDYSDIDLSVVMASEADVEPVFRDWDGKIQTLFPVVTRFETHYGPYLFLYGFLLDNILELDIGFLCLNNLVARRPQWQIAFDRSGQIQSIMEASLVDKPEAPEPDRYQQALESIWHYIMHSAICLRRKQNWRAVYYLDMVRQQTIELAGLRLGLETKNYRQVDQFPADLLLSWQQSLPSDLSPGKIMRALQTATQCFFDEAAIWERRSGGTLTDLLQSKMQLFLESIDEELNA